jgi:hypothetical protein
VAVAVVEYGIFIILFGLSEIVDDILINVFIVVTLIYVVLFLILVIKIWNVKDAFAIKKEFGGILKHFHS